MDEHLRQRIAEALGWTVEDTRRFSVPTLRELVRVGHPKLAYHLTEVIRRGEHLVGESLRSNRIRGSY